MYEVMNARVDQHAMENADDVSRLRSRLVSRDSKTFQKTRQILPKFRQQFGKRVLQEYGFPFFGDPDAASSDEEPDAGPTPQAAVPNFSETIEARQ